MCMLYGKRIYTILILILGGYESDTTIITDMKKKMSFRKLQKDQGMILIRGIQRKTEAGRTIKTKILFQSL